MVQGTHTYPYWYTIDKPAISAWNGGFSYIRFWTVQDGICTYNESLTTLLHKIDQRHICTRPRPGYELEKVTPKPYRSPDHFGDIIKTIHTSGNGIKKPQRGVQGLVRSLYRGKFQDGLKRIAWSRFESRQTRYMVEIPECTHGHRHIRIRA